MARSQPHLAPVVLPALILCVVGLQVRNAVAQTPADPARVTQIASTAMGSIAGVVLDDQGQPLDGVVISALGATSAFTVSDRVGQFTIRSLAPGPYLLRAHLQGYLPARNAMVAVRPSSRTVSSFTLRKEGKSEPRVALAGLGGAEVSAAPESQKPRDESETAWRLRHVKRSILRDAASYVETAAAKPERDWFLANSFELLGRAVGSSARMAGSLFAGLPLQGQVNLLTTGVFDNAFQLLQLEHTHSVAYFAVGAPVGSHGDWTVKAALNQGDLSSWILAGSFARREPATHRYQFGMSYGLHRYEGGNLAAMAAVPESARNVGSVYGSDEWRLSDSVSIGYGAHYAHYDYLYQPAHFSPRISATFASRETARLRAVAVRRVIAPGAEEFLPPQTHAQILPPQRTFSPLTRDRFVPENLQHYEVVVEDLFRGAMFGVRGFEQRVDNQLVTVFGHRNGDATPEQLGHYFVASAGDVALRGIGFTFAREIGAVRGSVDYSFSAAQWTANARLADRSRLSRRLPSALRDDLEFVHDLTTSVETVLPRTTTRVFFVVKMNNAFIRDNGTEDRPGLDGRFDVQLSQGLPFMNLFKADWEMVVGVRNLFHESLTEASLYDELLVARPPKRLVGGITVKF